MALARGLRAPFQRWTAPTRKARAFTSLWHLATPTSNAFSRGQHLRSSPKPSRIVVPHQSASISGNTSISLKNLMALLHLFQFLHRKGTSPLQIYRIMHEETVPTIVSEILQISVFMIIKVRMPSSDIILPPFEPSSDFTSMHVSALPPHLRPSSTTSILSSHST